MAFKGFFYNSIQVNGKHDRQYNADDYSNSLKFVVGNGIVHLNNGTNLQVLTDTNTSVKQLAANASTYSIKIQAGIGWINGKAFENDVEFAGDITLISNAGETTAATLATIPMATKGYKRIDRVIVRRDDSPAVRATLPFILNGVQVAEGTPASPTANFNFAGTINGQGNDICIAEILVDNTGDYPVITINDTRMDQTLCGWVNCWFGDNYEEVCSTINSVIASFIEGKTEEFNRWFSGVRDNVATVTMQKELTNSVTAETAGATFTIGIAEYDKTIDILNVYTNGIYENPSDYTINDDGTITFTTTKQAGAVIDFVVEKAIDARFYDNPDTAMIASVESRFNDIYTQLGGLQAFTYYCTGTDDNKTISNIVKSFMGANLTDNARLKLSVVGDFGATTPYQAQSTASDYDGYARWFDFSTTNASNRRVIIDFTNCTPITLTLPANTSNIIFYGANQEIENCILKAGSVNDTGTKIMAVFGRGDVHHKDCKYSFICDLPCDFTRHGKFDNCEVTLISKSGNATAFYTDPAGCICEVDRGIYWLYVGRNVDTNTFGTKLVYYNRGKSYGTETVDYSQLTILRDVLVPNYDNAKINNVAYLEIDGQYFKQTGTIFNSISDDGGGGGYIRSYNLITPRTANSIDASTDAIIEGTVNRNRALAQVPFV